MERIFSGVLVSKIFYFEQNAVAPVGEASGGMDLQHLFNTEAQ
jgi:hypothetical protein